MVRLDSKFVSVTDGLSGHFLYSVSVACLLISATTVWTAVIIIVNG